MVHGARGAPFDAVEGRRIAPATLSGSRARGIDLAFGFPTLLVARLADRAALDGRMLAATRTKPGVEACMEALPAPVSGDPAIHLRVPAAV